jgi:hypothetical protein
MCLPQVIKSFQNYTGVATTFYPTIVDYRHFICLSSRLVFEMNIEYQVQLHFILNITNIFYGTICNLSYHILCFRIIHLEIYRKHFLQYEMLQNAVAPPV